MKTLAIIPARKGSRRLPGKHQIRLLGKPMIAYTIEAAQSASRIDRLVLSTDDEALEPLAERHGVELLRRPSELATDSASLDDVFRHVCRQLEARDGWVPDVVVALSGNTPVRKEGQIDDVLARLEEMADATAVCTAVEQHARPEWAKRLDPDTGLVTAFMDGVRGIRKQDFPTLCMIDGAVAAMRYEALMAIEDGSRVPHAFLGDRVHVVLQEHAMYALEVDHPDEVPLAVFYLLYAARGDRLLEELGELDR